MNQPRVSICLPNLNNFPYLAERVATIEAQTFKDWELVICDNYSDDGAWEFFQELAKRNSKVRISQEPREGMYANWNNCVRQARGEFVYVATSDDTMALDCLDKMVGALVENPDCDLAHCPMKVIDEHGEPGLDWWSGNSLFAKSSGNFLNRRHKRLAPYDGVLCMLGDNIYSSVTQLLIRRTLFDKVGYYRTDWGSVGDFHWNLRAGLAASTVHVPDTWGGWRMHGDQATAGVKLGSAAHRKNLDSMIDDVMRDPDRFVGSKHRPFEKIGNRARDLRDFLREHGDQATTSERGMFLIRQALSGRGAAWRHLASMAFGDKRWPLAAPESVKSWFDNAMMVPVSGNGEAR